MFNNKADQDQELQLKNQIAIKVRIKVLRDQIEEYLLKIKIIIKVKTKVYQDPDIKLNLKFIKAKIRAF